MNDSIPDQRELKVSGGQFQWKTLHLGKVSAGSTGGQGTALIYLEQF